MILNCRLQLVLVPHRIFKLNVDVLILSSQGGEIILNSGTNQVQTVTGEKPYCGADCSEAGFRRFNGT